MGTLFDSLSHVAVGARPRGETLTYLTYVMPDESVRLQTYVLRALYSELGERGAQDVVTRAMEDLAQRLQDAERLYRAAEFSDLRKAVRAMVAVAEQIGMGMLAACAVHVVACIDAGDPVALAATLARLMRIGDRSLNAVWELQGLSI